MENLDKKLLPILSKITENKIIKSVQNGIMMTMPLTLGTVIIAILVNLPFETWTTFLRDTGIEVHMLATIKVTMEATAVFITFMVGYYHAVERGKAGTIGGLLSLGAFLILIPHEIFYEGGSVEGIDFNFLGADGIFGGIILAIVISGIYSFLDNKGLKIKLPNSVPPTVSQSLSPTFIAIIVFTAVFLVRLAFSYTSFGSYFIALNTLVITPLLALGTTPVSAIIFMSLVSLAWFFGIHPNVIVSMYLPIMMTVKASNINAFLNSEQMPFFIFSSIMLFHALGGTGNTLGLTLVMPFISKSERYKSLGKLSLAPSLFNINEPVIFGLPIVLNPIFFIPLLLTSIFNGFMGGIFYKFGFLNKLNPTISLPWSTPIFVTSLLKIGYVGIVLTFIVIVIDTIIYYPFFKKADQLEYLKEIETSNAIAKSNYKNK